MSAVERGPTPPRAPLRLRLARERFDRAIWVRKRRHAAQASLDEVEAAGRALALEAARDGFLRAARLYGVDDVTAATDWELLRAGEGEA